jgi:hypothetical protein
MDQNEYSSLRAPDMIGQGFFLPLIYNRKCLFTKEEKRKPRKDKEGGLTYWFELTVMM